jgi:hypothetical protein
MTFPILRQCAISGLIGLIALLSCPFLIYDTMRMSYFVPINYNEGWNALHTARFLRGGALYVPIHDLPITPVNYPPLSFLVIGTVSKLTGSILFSGRAVSFLSFLLIGYLIFKIIHRITSETLAALLGALLWLAILLRFVESYVGMYDPQMLAHVFSTLAIYFYVKWRDNFDIRKIWILALLSCLALFTKHLLIAVPLTLTLTLLCLNRKACLLFILAGISTSSVLLFSTWLYGGENFLLNFIELDRPTSSLIPIKSILSLFVKHFLGVLFPPFILLCFIYQRTNTFILIFFIISFLIGSIAARGVGVNKNAWFDFFIASSLIFGVFSAYIQNIIEKVDAIFSTKVYLLLAGRGRRLKVLWASTLTYGALAAVLLPFTSGLKQEIKGVLDYRRLDRQEESYQNDINLLRSIQGPALYEDLLMGFLAGKEYLVDPFSSAQMIRANRFPEELLVERIRNRYFTVIVLYFDIDEKIRSLNESKKSSTGLKSMQTDRWTNNTLKAIYENYELFSIGKLRGYYYRARRMKE